MCDWGHEPGGTGTSFSTPEVASMIALFKQACSTQPIGYDAYLRAVTREAAWALNPSHLLYETPGEGFDGHDGAGFLGASQLMEFCSGSGPNNTSGYVGSPTGGPGPSGSPPPKGAPPFDDGGISHSSVGAGIHLQNENLAPGSNDGRYYYKIFTSAGAIHGVRATVSWDACPAQMTGTAPAAPKTDHDLFLYDQTAHAYLYSSQSNDDNNEGFDFPFNGSTSDTIVVYVAWPQGSTGCTGGGADPFAWAVHYY
jgi:hypothetical protein